MGNTSVSPIAKDECFICFNETNDKQHLLYCGVCKHVCHRKCYRQWWEKKNIKTPYCLYCQQIQVLELRRPWFLACFNFKHKIY